MNQEMMTHMAAQAFGLKTKESCAQFLSAASDAEDWILRIRYIASWSDNSDELWDYVKKESWVRATAMIIGVAKKEEEVLVGELVFTV